VNHVEVLSPAKTVSMADEWFDIANADHFWMRWRFAILCREMQRLGIDPGKALEIGCGHGVLRQQMEEAFKVPVDGCDLNQNALQMAPAGRGRLLVYDIFDELPEMCRAYDMILLMDVIEHLDDDMDFLQTSLKHLKPGGIVAINVPAHMSLYSKYDKVAGHKRRYNRERLRLLFESSSVTPLAIVNWGFSMVPVLIVRKLVLKFVSEERTIETGFAPPKGLMNSGLNLLKAIETGVPFGMPIGSSIMALGRLKEASSHPQ
jgi:SAM-dependent methyltransferase